jgi:CheY-like chemotaxis protein
MNAILGFGQLLEIDKNLNPLQLDYIQEISNAGHHLLDLINEVLDLSRIETGKIDLSMEPILCDALVAECVSLVEPLATNRGIHMDHQPAPGLAVLADRVRLKQVVVNLLSNAVKYNRPEGKVNVVCTVEGALVCITVVDTGLGIPEDRMQELFVPFSRLGAEAGEIEGTGIGLTISKRLTEMMGGRIGARSESGTGSSFWIELPLVEPEEGAATTWKSQGVGSPTAIGEAEYTVLYIEDNPANLRLVSQILSLRAHIHLLTAPEPSIGLDLAEAYRPDLILLDLNMPEMDGYGVLRILRSSEWGKDIPVIAVTAHAMYYDIQKGKAAGFVEYLTKPLDIPRFLAVIDSQLEAGASGKTKESTHG